MEQASVVWDLKYAIYSDKIESVQKQFPLLRWEISIETVALPYRPIQAD